MLASNPIINILQMVEILRNRSAPFIARLDSSVLTARQITKLHQRRMDFEVIRRRIEQSGEPGAQSLESRAYPRRQRKIVTEFPSPGSPQRKERLVSFQLRHQRDAPFRNFTKELYQFLTYMVYGPAGTQKIVSLDATNGMRVS
jgi:hypothetical protein